MPIEVSRDSFPLVGSETDPDVADDELAELDPFDLEPLELEFKDEEELETPFVDKEDVDDLRELVNLPELALLEL